MIRKKFQMFSGLRQQYVEGPAQEELPEHLAMSAFFKQTKEEQVYVGSVDLEEIEIQERVLEDERVNAIKNSQIQQKKKAVQMIEREMEARQQVDRLHKQNMSEMAAAQKVLASKKSGKLSNVGRAFKAVKTRLHKVLDNQKQIVGREFGRFVDGSDFFGGPEHAKHNWNASKRRIRVRVDYLREVKNKVPGGKYVMMVTLYDRLGGFPIRSPENDHFAFTQPVLHTGKFRASELSFHSHAHRMNLMCPSKNTSRPSNVLIFELFQIRGGSNKTDRVKAWGCMPLIASNFDTISGKFKFPLLRGEVDRSIDKYEIFERKICDDIDSWLCNCYIDVKHGPR